MGTLRAMSASVVWSEEVRRLAGARLQRTRLQQGLSIRTLAARANLSKTTILAVEAGNATRPGTYLKVAAQLGLHLDVLTRELAPSELPFAVHHIEDDNWYDLAGFGDGPLPSDAQSDSERRKLLAEGGIVPLNILRSRLEGGRIKPTLIEVVAASPQRSHAGEEYIYVLGGVAVITIGGHRVVLKEGESVTFWSSEPHSYAPAEGSTLPARLLSMRVDS